MKKILPVLLLLSIPFFSAAQTRPQAVQNLASFCKLWGFLKYHHPQVATGKFDWDKEFMSRLTTVASLQSKQELNTYYSNWLKSLGPVKPCTKCKNNIPDSLLFNMDRAWLSDTSIFTAEVITQLTFIQENRHTGKNYYVQQQKLIGNTKYGNEKPYKDSIFPSKELRLLGLARYWNIINYFFPYKYRMDENWNTVLIEMLPKFKDAKDTIAYHLAMKELTASINDSHAGFTSKYTNQFFGLKWAPFQFKLIDNKAIVTGYYNDSLCKLNDIRYGDVFLKVGTMSIGEIIKEKSKYIGASNEAAKLREFYYILFNGETDSVVASFERNGSIVEKFIYRYSFKDFNYNWRTDIGADTCKLLAGNIGYLNLGLLRPQQTHAYLQKLKSTKAIIFDVRNYPNGTMYDIALFLNAEKKAFAKFTAPDLSHPGVYRYTPNYYCGSKNKNHYKGKVILLFDESSQSHAEFTLMALQTAPNVIGIGSQTAGADGNVSLLTFPGNYKTYMTGIGVYYPNGRETQRIGIVPDIEAKPTIEGLKLKKDEVLEKAILVINGN